MGDDYRWLWLELNRLCSRLLGYSDGHVDSGGGRSRRYRLNLRSFWHSKGLQMVNYHRVLRPIQCGLLLARDICSPLPSLSLRSIGVDSQVPFQLVASTESFHASRKSASVRFFAGVGTYMPSLVFKPVKAFVT